jgi:hypothetical protein
MGCDVAGGEPDQPISHRKLLPVRLGFPARSSDLVTSFWPWTIRMAAFAFGIWLIRDQLKDAAMGVALGAGFNIADNEACFNFMTVRIKL